MLNTVIFGPPGSGKGTQSKLIAEKFGYMHLSTGELFRKEISMNTAMGELLQKFIRRGLLVPDSIVLRELFKEALNYRNYPGLLFDGFPRTVHQAQLLHRVLGKKGIDIHMVVSIEVPEDELISRILKRSVKEARSDDNIEAFHQRYLQYQHLTLPVMKYYKHQKILYTIDGTKEVDKVFSSIVEIIEDKIIEKNYKNV
jgi:adenylate kinase